jgi:hypothetical protein
MTKEMELLLASELDLHPEIHVKGSCQHMELVDQEKGPRSRVSHPPKLNCSSRESAIFNGGREVADFWIVKQELFCNSNFPTDRFFGGQLQNNDCKASVVSVTARSRLGTALYTVGKSNCQLQN